MAAGKVVDQFLFKRHGTVLKVPVRLFKDTEYPPEGHSRRTAGPTQTSGAHFGVSLDKPKVELWSTDIEALRKAVMDALDDHYSLDWEEWCIVEVSDPNRYGDDDGAGVEVCWESILICKTPDGEILHRRTSWRRSNEICKGLPPLRGGRRGRDAKKALIRLTPDSIKALEAFRDRLIVLRGQIAGFLSAENISDSLQRVLSLLPPALPAPKKKGKKGKAKKVKPLKPSVVEAEVREAMSEDKPDEPAVSRRAPDRPPPMKLRWGTKKVRPRKRRASDGRATS